MIRAVRAINQSGQSILMQLNGLEQGPFSLWAIEGLDPGEADINVTEIATVDGAVFNMARQTSRELTLTVLLNWYDNGHYMSIQSAREEVYKYFPLKKQVRIVFYLDDVKNAGQQIAYATDAYVKSVTVDIFAKTCAAKITVLRTNPLFFEYETQPILAGSIANSIGFTSISISDVNKLASKIGIGNRTLFEFKLADGYYRWVIDGVNQSIDYDIAANYGISAEPDIFNLPNSATIYVIDTASYVVNKTNFAAKTYQPLTNVDESQISLLGSESVGCDIVIPFKVDFSTFKNYYAVSTDVPLKDAYIFEIYIKNIIGAASYSNAVQDGNFDLKIYPNKFNQYAGTFFDTQYIIPGDIIVISTEKGKKNVTFTRGYQSISMLGLLDSINISSNDWIRLSPGENHVQVIYKTQDIQASMLGSSTDRLINKGIVYSGSDTTPPNTFHVQYINAKRGL